MSDEFWKDMSKRIERNERAREANAETARTYVTMAGKSIGQCSSGHWLPLSGNCDLCGAGPDQKCGFSTPREMEGKTS